MKDDSFKAADAGERYQWTKLSEAFCNVSESFGGHSVVYVIPAYDFRLKLLFGILENSGNCTYGNKAYHVYDRRMHYH